MNYYIADTHFGDERIMKLSRRPFSNVVEMDNALLKNWNDIVSDEDTVYILGDFAADDYTAGVVKRLKGKKVLLLGNHDNVLSLSTLENFEKVDKILTIEEDGKFVCLCHYPLVSYANSIYGGYHLFGHIHNNENDRAYKIMKGFKRAFNCGVDENDFKPKTLMQFIGDKRNDL